MNRIWDAVFEASNQFWFGCAFTIEWFCQNEIHLGWLRCLDAMLERDAPLRAGLTAAGWAVQEGDAAAVNRKGREVVLSAFPEPRAQRGVLDELSWRTCASLLPSTRLDARHHNGTDRGADRGLASSRADRR